MKKSIIFTLVTFLAVCLTANAQTWTAQNIGATLSGTSSINSTTGVYTVQAAGTDINSTSDQFEFLYQPISGDGVVIARVVGQQNTNASAKAGIMIRNTLDANSANVFFALTPSSAVTFQTRTTAGGGTSNAKTTSSPAPIWLKMEHLGSLFRASTSADGNTWTVIGTTTLTMNSSVYAGLAVCSHNATTYGTAVFDNVSLTATGSDGLQSPWSRTDVGSPAVVGYTQYASSIYTEGGAGTDISGTTDQFSFAYQPLVGDGLMTAQITSQQSTNAAAKAGVMIRETLSGSSRHSFMALTPGTGFDFLGRVTSSGSTFTIPIGSGTAPVWVGVQRIGNTLLGWNSLDGANWNMTGSVTLPGLATQVYAGLAVTSHNTTTMSTVTFGNVTLSLDVPAPTVPSPWTSVDIGSPTAQGNISGVLESDGKTLSAQVLGSGSDITGTSDQFRYTYIPLNGNGKIVAQVTAQTPTAVWAKAGLMIRQNTNPNSQYSMVVVTPGNGIEFQSRLTAGGLSPAINGTGSPVMPQWLRLERIGNLFTAWNSTDGNTWTVSGTTTIAMSSNVLIGLPVSSWNTNVASAATFANVLVTTPADPTWDSDNNGLPDAWEIQYFGAIGQNPNALSPSGDGLTLAQDYQLGNSPFDFYRPPTNVTVTQNGLVLWLSADSGVTADSSGKVLQWLDQSGRNLQADQGQVANQPLLVSNALNGKPVIRFDGGSSYLRVVPAGAEGFTGGGLTGVYYGNTGLAGTPILTRLDSTVNFDWGDSPAGYYPSAPKNGNFSARWTGQVVPLYSGTYTFYTSEDDGARLSVNGQLVINQWHEWLTTLPPYTAQVVMNAGQAYNIQMDYFENFSSPAGVSLSWSGPNLPKSIISPIATNNVLADFTKGMTAIVVANPAQTASSSHLFDFGNGASSDNLFLSVSAITQGLTFGLYDGAKPGGITAIASTPPNQFQILAGVFDGNSSASLYRNGVLIKQGNPGAVRNVVRAVDYIGKSNWSSDALYQGDIAEILVYNRPLSAAELQNIQLYLNQKYSVGTPPVATAPTITLPASNNSSSQTVVLSAPAGSTIYYTTDGSTPTTSSTVYSGPITVTTSETIKAIATQPGYAASSVSSASVTTPAPAPTFGVAAGTYFTNQTETLSATSGATIYYTTDGSVPTTGSPIYSGSIPVTTTTTINAFCTAPGFTPSSVVGATISIYGAPSWSEQDIGTGTSGAFSQVSGTYTLQGSGTQVGGGADSFNYAYIPADGNTETIVRVVSQTNTNNYANTGIMVRESLDPGSSYAMISTSPGSGLNFSYRAGASTQAVEVLGKSISAPVWLKLVRSGNTFAGYESTDGQSWVLVGEGAITMANAYYAGLVECSDISGTSGTSIFDHVSVLANVPQVGPNLQLWLRSDANVSFSGSNQINQWADQSENGNNVVQTATTSQPTYQTGVINGEPTVRFNGSSSFLSGTTTVGLKGNNVTMISVYRPLATGTNSPIIAQPYNTGTWSAPYESWGLESSAGIPTSLVGANGALNLSGTSPATSTGTPYLVEGVYDGLTLKTYVNGLSTGQNTIGGSIAYGSASGFNLGADGSGGDWLNGDIAEVLVYNTALNDAQRQQTEAYIYQKYGVGNPPTNTAPVMDLPPGSYSAGQTTTLEVPPGSTIYYTTDGSTPTTSSAVYSGTGIPLTSTMVLKAIAVRAGYSNSTIASATYSVSPSQGSVSRNGLQLWLKADALSGNSGDAVGLWPDQSGSGNTVRQVNGSNRPTFQTNVINGEPTVRFNGSSSYLSGVTTAGLKGSAVTTIAVYRPSGSGTNSAIIAQPYNSGTWSAPYQSWGLQSSGSAANGIPTSRIAVSGTLNVSGTSPVTTSGTSYLVEGVFDGSSHRIYVNGTLSGSNAVNGTIGYGTATSFNVGADGSGSDFLNGDVAEVLVYNRALTDADRQEIEAYVFQKYGFPNVPQQVAPTISVPAGTYSTAQNVQLSTPNSGATIYYTTDGSQPTTSSPSVTSGGVVAVSQTGTSPTTTTINAMAVATGYSNSTVSTSTITIDASSANVSRLNLELWLKADSLSSLTSGSTVGQWLDQSGNGNNVVQTATTSQPTYQTSVINGEPVVRFNGTGAYLSGVTTSGPSGLQGNTVTMIAVYRPSGTSANSAIVAQPYNSGTSSAPYVSWGLQSSGSAGTGIPTFQVAPGGIPNVSGTSPATTVGTPYLVEGVYDWQSARIYVNGILTGSNAVNGPIGYGSATSFNIGTDGSGADWMSGDVAEILVYNTALSDSERQQIETYLYQKYGVGTQQVTANPTFSAPTSTSSGTFEEISAPGATIYYTTDGSQPVVGGTLSASNSISFTLSGTASSSMTINAIAVSPGLLPSPVQSVTLSIDPYAANLPQQGPELWYKADDSLTGTTSGSAVSQWIDQSGNGNNVVQSATASQPTYQSSVINGKPTVRFNGTGNFLSGTTTNGLPFSAVTMVAIYQPSGTAANSTIIAQPYNSGTLNPTFMSWGLQSSGSAGNGVPASRVVANQALTVSGTSPVTTAGTPYLVEGVYDGSSNRIYVNGVLSGSNAASWPISHGTATNFNVGTDAGAADWMNGDIAEILVYDRALTDADRNQVEAYVKLKYGVGNAPLAVAPVIETAPGTYSQEQEVFLSGTNGGTIYYTTDGSIPTTSSLSMAGSGSITVSGTGTTIINAIDVIPGYANSPVSTTQITIDPTTANLPQGSLALWLKADSLNGISSGSSVSQWADQSGNQHNVVQSSTASRPTFQTNVINGQPVVRFNGTSTFLSGSTSTLLTGSDVTMIAVYRPLAAGTNSAIFAQPYNSGSWSAPYESWGLQSSGSGDGIPTSRVTVSGTLNVSGTSPATTTGTPYLVEGVFDGASHRMYVNGALTGSNVVSGTIGYGTATSFNVGTDGSGSDWLNGDIAEVLVYSRNLSDVERQEIEAYIYHKYGIGSQPATASPAFSVPAATYAGAQSEALTATTGATIYYTTDGSTPTTSSTVYGVPISVTSSETIKAIAVLPGLASSPMASAQITIDFNSAPVTRSGLQAWYRADVGVALSGSNVSQWADQSGNGGIASQGTSGLQPLYVANTLNSKPVVRFDGVGNVLLTGTANLANGSNDVSIFVVTTPAASLTQAAYADMVDFDHADGTNSGFALEQNNTSNDQFYFGWSSSGTAEGASAPVGLSSGNPHVLSVVKSGTSQNLYVDGSVQGTLSVPATMSLSPHALGIGRSVSVSQRLYGGDIAEILIYNRKLSDSETTQVQYYLNQKYALNVPAVASPQFSTPGGTLSGPGQVAITAPTGATIYYTTDGTTPTTSSAIYTGPISVNYTQTIKAIAFEDGQPVSSVTSVTYTLDATLWPAPDPSDTTPMTIDLQLPTNAVLQ